MERVAAPGAELWTATSGSGPPLVLAHGGPGMWDYMGPVAEMVDDLVTVHRYDQRGSGRSPAPPPYDLGDFITDLEGLRRHWGHERWIVGGHSWGAQLGLLYAGRHPQRVAGLLLLSTSGLVEPDVEARRRAVERRLGAAGTRRLTELSERLAADPGDGAADRELTRLGWSAEFARAEAGEAFADELLGSGFQIDQEVSRAPPLSGTPFSGWMCRRWWCSAPAIYGRAHLPGSWRTRCAVRSYCWCLEPGISPGWSGPTCSAQPCAGSWRVSQAGTHLHSESQRWYARLHYAS